MLRWLKLHYAKIQFVATELTTPRRVETKQFTLTPQRFEVD